MKRIALLIMTLALTMAVVFYFQTPETETNSTEIRTKKHKTPAELKAERVQMKIERRKTGWSRPDKPSEFLKYHQRIRTKEGASVPDYPNNYKLNELNKLKSRSSFLKSASTPLDWKEVGPGNVSGRSRSLIIDPDDKTGNTWIAGSVGGGIWKTSDAGNSWTNLTPDLPALSITCMAISESNTQIIYAGTGESFGNADGIVGDGMFKTSDKGDTWVQLGSTSSNDDFHYMNRIIVDPQNEDVVLAATKTSIQKSIDGGTSWTSVFNDNSKILQILPNPDDFNILYATSDQYGILKSEDAGDTWKYVFNINLGRIELAISSSDTKIIYALDEDSELFISTNSGTDWTTSTIAYGSQDLYLSDQGYYNNTLIVNPDDSSSLYIGGLNLYKVDVIKDASSTSVFTYVYSDSTYQFMDFVNYGGSYSGGTFELYPETDKSRTVEVLFGPGRSQKAHRFTVPEGSTSGVSASSYSYNDYISVPFEVWDTTNNQQLMISFRDQDRNGAFNLTELNDALSEGREYIWINDVAYSETTPSTSITQNGGQEYNQLAYWWPVLQSGASWDPDNLPESKIVITSIEVYDKQLKSTRLTDWAGVDYPYIHADLHQIQVTQTESGTSRIVVCNDGGVAYSDDEGSTWSNPANGYNTTQFYGVDKHPTENRYIGGLQDNGSFFSPQDPDALSNWTEASGGDGFDAVWNSYDPDKIISSLYYNYLYFSYDGGDTWQGSFYFMDDTGSENAPFSTKIGYSPLAPDRIAMVGNSGVSISNDFGTTWEQAEFPSGGWYWSYSGSVVFSITAPDIMWAASYISGDGHINYSVDGGLNFYPASNEGLPTGYLSGLATHPSDKNTAYALYSYSGEAKILRTTDLGETWEDISGFDTEESNNGFPDVAVYSLLVMPNNTDEIWAGTEIGLVISTDNGQTWEYADNGFPSVAIWDMKIRGEQIIVATHGRGIWTLDVPELANIPKAPTLISAANNNQNQTNIQFIYGALYDSTRINIDSTYTLTIAANASYSEIETRAFDFEIEEGTHTLKMIGYVDSVGFESITKTFSYYQFNSAADQYINTFTEISDDFIGDDFTIETYSILGTGMAIHSKHPYDDNKNISYLLRTPIIVKGTTTNGTRLKYKDIPMIEEGEDGSEYMSANFYDYVIVEASNDGINWTALVDGYDFREIKGKALLLGKTVDSTPRSSLYITHDINLLHHFQANDTILVRFRLYSDASSNGWGWVIDNVDIQQTTSTGVEKLTESNTTLYPIPCDKEMTLELDDSFSQNADLSIFDMNGRRIQQQTVDNQSKVTINTSSLKPGLYILKIKSGDNYEQKKFQVKQ
jgi:photosystem II stability/assembly factor-like uncharacterized protein